MFLLRVFRVFFAFATLNVVALLQHLFPRPLARIRLRAVFRLYQCGMGADDVAISHVRVWGYGASRALLALCLDPHARPGMRRESSFMLRLCFPDTYKERCDEIVASMPNEQNTNT